MSRKSERLVNLTIALLATKRWLTKSQIFSSIDGYEGEPEAKERMFERDKNDLRKMGIAIEVGTFDPLFEDEVGYRIRPDSYRTEISSLTSFELSLISQSRQVWRGAVLEPSALSGLVKLKSLGADSDFGSIPAVTPSVSIPDANFAIAIDAISERKAISFTYIAADLQEQSRLLEPYGVATKAGYWYLAGRDIEKSEERLFRLDRISSAIELQGRANSYDIPENFSMAQMLQPPTKKLPAVLRVRFNKAHALREPSTLLSDDGEWTTLSYPYFAEDELIAEVLWHLDDAEIVEPFSARMSIIDALKEIVELHG